MNEKYWDLVSANYEKEITSVFFRDKEGLVRERINAGRKLGASVRAADLGCGVGNFVPLLSETFGHVDACDWSEVGLNQARENCISFENTKFHKINLCNDRLPFDLVDFALCVNVLIMPDLGDRLLAWRAVTNQVKGAGTLLLVVPSHESAQMELYNGLEQCLSDGESCSDSIIATQHAEADSSDLQLGVYSVNGTRTKHYLKQELRMMLASHQFEVLEITRIVYPKDVENPVSDSWDWMVVAKRRLS
ncbi:class I SAM-dependent methyltransferase [Puniceicoccaceae bacterium K14]|nr:class I SAM-dependent methyltransferase [Puniceicoccaceae bacterium K14]